MIMNSTPIWFEGNNYRKYIYKKKVINNSIASYPKKQKVKFKVNFIAHLLHQSLVSTIHDSIISSTLFSFNARLMQGLCRIINRAYGGELD